VIVVSDTTPLHYLAVLGALDVLPRLFGTVLCPPEVLAECLHPSAPEALRTWASKPPDWLKIEETGGLDKRVQGLDSGEAAALSLALRLRADLVLVDERKGRARASRLGLRRAGTLGVLAEAGRRGWLDYSEATDRLLRDTNFRVDPAVVEETWVRANSTGGVG
jgi:predicted nucleic acid-binding protein